MDVTKIWLGKIVIPCILFFIRNNVINSITESKKNYLHFYQKNIISPEIFHLQFESLARLIDMKFSVIKNVFKERAKYFFSCLN